MESRISLLYGLLEKRIMPWMWDWDHYGNGNEDMIGMFYPEDFHAYLQIEYFVSQAK